MLAIIPARGGSKGVVNKNIRSVGGEPLITHAINAALAAKSINHVLVTTDSEKIARVALDAGADVPFIRPAALATDTIPLGHACIHALNWMEGHKGWKSDEFVIIQCACPLVLPEDIDQAVQAFKEHSPDAVVSLAALRVPLAAIFEVSAGGLIERPTIFTRDTELLAARRQETKPHFRMLGAVTVVRRALMEADVNYFYSSKNVQAVIIPDDRAIDVDDEIDLMVADALMTKRKRCDGL